MATKLFSELPRGILRMCLAKIQRTFFWRAISGYRRRGVAILEASDADLKQVRRVFALEVAPSLPEDRDVVHFVAKKGREIVGFAQLVRPSEGAAPDEGYCLFSLNVHPLYRGLGIGRDLTEQVIARAKDEKAPELLVITRENNRIALALFHQSGFQNRGQEQRASLKGRKNLVLAKTLVD